MFLHDARRDREPEARADTRRLGRKKRLEDARQVRFGDARPESAITICGTGSPLTESETTLPGGVA